MDALERRLGMKAASCIACIAVRSGPHLRILKLFFYIIRLDVA
jgi:hypothetical protein